MNFVDRALKLFYILRVSGFRRVLFRYGVAAGIEHVSVLKQIQFRTLVDVGANRGQFALAARYCAPAARIISFEPLSGPAAKYRKVFSEDVGASLHQTAIGTSACTAEIHLSGRDDSSSLLPITSKQEALFPGTGEAGRISIDLCRLDHRVSAAEIEKPAVLKLDVQGFELEVLKGCESLLAHFDWVYAECSFLELYEGQALAHEVIDWLTRHGFVLCGVHNMSYESCGQAVQADFLFRRLMH